MNKWILGWSLYRDPHMGSFRGCKCTLSILTHALLLLILKLTNWLSQFEESLRHDIEMLGFTSRNGGKFVDQMDGY